MPDDNRFAGLSEAVDEDETDEPDGESTATSAADDAAADESNSAAEELESAGDTESESNAESTQSDAETSGTETPDAESTEPDDPTAFPFDAAEKKTVYVRPETLDALEDARALVDAQLRTQHDVRDLTGREFYDAVFRLAASDTDELIETVLEARDE